MRETKLIGTRLCTAVEFALQSFFPAFRVLSRILAGMSLAGSRPSHESSPFWEVKFPAVIQRSRMPVRMRREILFSSCLISRPVSPMTVQGVRIGQGESGFHHWIIEGSEPPDGAIKNLSKLPRYLLFRYQRYQKY